MWCVRQFLATAVLLVLVTGQSTRTPTATLPTFTSTATPRVPSPTSAPPFVISGTPPPDDDSWASTRDWLLIIGCGLLLCLLCLFAFVLWRQKAASAPSATPEKPAKRPVEEPLLPKTPPTVVKAETPTPRSREPVGERTPPQPLSREPKATPRDAEPTTVHSFAHAEYLPVQEPFFDAPPPPEDDWNMTSSPRSVESPPWPSPERVESTSPAACVFGSPRRLDQPAGKSSSGAMSAHLIRHVRKLGSDGTPSRPNSTWQLKQEEAGPDAVPPPLPPPSTVALQSLAASQRQETASRGMLSFGKEHSVRSARSGAPSWAERNAETLINMSTRMSSQRRDRGSDPPGSPSDGRTPNPNAIPWI
eukprot:Sspe_Gene.44494::Locus_21824_Transcript_2_2_Confidence_0.667_Length_3979::g.44494::m.44494